MMRAVASRRPRIDIPAFSSGTHQKRRKTFTRHKPSGETDAYYTINKTWPSTPKGVPDRELFKISDLLLDLDDVDSKHVRPFMEQDEVELGKKWEASAQLGRLSTRMDEMKSQLDHTRRKAFEISSQPGNVWRVTNHDILSVALRGGPERAPLIGSEEEAHHGEVNALKASEALDPRRGPTDILHSVCVENGISNYAAQHDKLLLHWLQSRQWLARPKSPRNDIPLTPRQFTAVLNQQKSISSIRRLVSQCLSSGLDATLFQTRPKRQSDKPHSSLSYEIRSACVNILNQLEPRDASIFGALTFLGNLQQRLASHYQTIGGPLCGLGLILSARIGNLDATLEYLVLGFKHNIWSETSGALLDILSTLDMLSRHLTVASLGEPFFFNIPDRQMLLGLLTGIDMGEGKYAWTVSFRALVLFFVENCSGDEKNVAVELYRTYILMLGRLGAVATLWKEWRLMGAEVQKQSQKWKILQHQPDTEKAFIAAIGTALSVVARREHAVPMDLGLADCATLDLESIEMQDPEAWCNSWKDGGLVGGSANDTMLVAIGGALDGWLAVVDSVAGPTRGAPSRPVGEMDVV